MLAATRAVLAASLAAWLTACGAAAPAGPAKPSPARRAPVVVTIVVDQLGAWVAKERWPVLPETGGFARLRREGTWMTDVRYAHAITDTGPGHAALYTGVPPREHGMWTNDVIDLDAAPGTKRALLKDPAARTLGADGPLASPGGSSPAVLTAPTLADDFRAAHPDAVIIALSLKDRGTLFAGGKHPSAALWWDRTTDQFVTSTAVAPEFPSWAAALSRNAALVARREPPWTIADPTWLAAHVGDLPDAGPEEGDIGGFGLTFPHDYAKSTSPAMAWRSSPREDETVLDLARAALDALATDPTKPVFLALSLSGNDYVGHVFTPKSWEAWDALYRLDANLGAFFADLDRRYGADGWSVVLTADHGVRPDVGRRVMPEQIAAELETAMKPLTKLPRTIAGLPDPYLMLSKEALALPPAELEKVRTAVEAALMKVPGVKKLYRADAAPETCPPETDESDDALVCRSIPRGLGPHDYILLEPGSFFDLDIVPGKGSGHGLPALHDRTVPVLVRAPGQIPAGQVDDAPHSFRVFHATVAKLLGLP